jgi:3-oxoacyl-[acyl-carrier protein] reductase
MRDGASARPASALLAGRIASVTGASRGIGAATARRLASHGVSVGVNYHRSREAAERVVADITALGASAVAVQADVGDGEQVEAMVDEVERRLGPIDTLVANAIAHRAAVFGAFAESTWDDFQDVVIGEIAAVGR